MSITKVVKDFVQYITEGFIAIFSPDRDSYPAVGIQPFGGTITDNSRFDW